MGRPDTRSTDEELVRRARAGDRDATEELLRRHRDAVARVCSRLCRDRLDAEDATQEALVAIVKGLDRFDGRSSFSTWAYRIAANRSLDELRRHRRRPPPADPHALTEHAGGLNDGSVDPADRAAAADERDRVLRCVAALPEEFRDAVILRDVLDMDYSEIALHLDVPAGTVRSRIARGRARVADALQAEGLFGETSGQDRPTDRQRSTGRGEGGAVDRRTGPPTGNLNAGADVERGERDV